MSCHSSQNRKSMGWELDYNVCKMNTFAKSKGVSYLEDRS